MTQFCELFTVTAPKDLKRFKITVFKAFDGQVKYEDPLKVEEAMLCNLTFYIMKEQSQCREGSQ